MANLPVVIGEAARKGLEALIRAGNTAQKIALRARIALLISEGGNNSEIGRQLEIDRKTVILWRAWSWRRS